MTEHKPTLAEVLAAFRSELCVARTEAAIVRLVDYAFSLLPRDAMRENTLVVQEATIRRHNIGLKTYFNSTEVSHGIKSNRMN